MLSKGCNFGVVGGHCGCGVTMLESVSTILGAEFPKIAGVGGLVLVVLGVAPGKLTVSKIVVPARDGIGRFLAVAIGFVFVSVPLIGFYFDTTIGLVNATPQNSITMEGEASPLGSLIIDRAYAAERRYSLNVGQDSMIDTAQIFGPGTALYVGEIHLQAPNVVLVYRTGGRGADAIRAGVALDEARARSMLDPQAILFLGSLKQGDRTPLIVDGKRYMLEVDRVVWFVVGRNAMKLTITG